MGFEDTLFVDLVVVMVKRGLEIVAARGGGSIDGMGVGMGVSVGVSMGGERGEEEE